MVNNDILGGIEAAMVRGQTLRQAMVSFYNAGYDKLEIEEAARQVSQGLAAQPVAAKPVVVKPVAQPVAKQPGKVPVKTTLPIQPKAIPPKRIKLVHKKIPKTKQRVSVYGKKPKLINNQVPKPPVIVQKISNYAKQSPKQISKAVTFFLVFILIFLLGALVAVFFFKQELIDLFNKLNLS